MVNYQDPRWQKCRLEILERDGWRCKRCGDKNNQLDVHHFWYGKDFKLWEYPSECFITLCNNCHSREHLMRKEIEAALVSQLAKHSFLSDDILSLIKLLPVLQDHRFIFGLLKYVCSDKKIYKNLMKKYMESDAWGEDGN